jgi:hypothetical protein
MMRAPPWENYPTFKQSTSNKRIRSTPNISMIFSQPMNLARSCVNLLLRKIKSSKSQSPLIRKNSAKRIRYPRRRSLQLLNQMRQRTNQLSQTRNGYGNLKIWASQRTSANLL